MIAGFVKRKEETFGETLWGELFEFSTFTADCAKILINRAFQAAADSYENANLEIWVDHKPLFEMKTVSDGINITARLTARGELIREYRIAW